MTGRTLLLFSVLLGISAAVPFPDPRYRNAPRISQRRLGPAPPGDYPNQSFEEYLASNGVSFDSLFEEPAPLRPEAPPTGGRRSSLFDALPDRPLPGQRTYAPPQAPRADLRPGSQSLFRDEPGSQSLYRDESGSQPLYRDEPVRRRPEPVTERPVRPTQRPLRRVIELKPAPAVADETGQESRQQLIPFIDTERSQPAAESRQGDDYSFSVPPKKEKQRLEFHVHGQEGPHSYRFGYDTGTGYNRQFRFEERDGHGNTKGRYGFYDKSGKLQVVNYSASPHGGFHAEAGH